MIPLYGNRDLTTIKFINVEVKCSSSPIFTRSDIYPIGHTTFLLKPTRGIVAGTICLFTSGQSLLKKCSYSISEADPPSTYIRCIKWPPISASMIMGPSVPSSLPSGGNESFGSREKLCVIFCLDTLCYGWTIRIAMALSLSESKTFPWRHCKKCEFVTSSFGPFAPIYYLHFLRAALLFVNGSSGSGFLSVRTHFFLYPQSMEYVSFPSSFISPPVFWAASDAGLSVFFEVCCFSFPTVFRTAGVGGYKICNGYEMGLDRLLGRTPKTLSRSDLALNEVIEMISCTNESKPLALPWGRTPRLDSGMR
nr:hypothetical protein [Tanacetum cinerariifolium]